MLLSLVYVDSILYNLPWLSQTHKYNFAAGVLKRNPQACSIDIQWEVNKKKVFVMVINSRIRSDLRKRGVGCSKRHYFSKLRVNAPG